MATLDTYAQVDAELAATAGYDVERDVAKAIRRVAALRRKLDFVASSSDKMGSFDVQQQIIADQLQQAIEFVRANETVTAAQKLLNPGVLHYDQSTFGQYAGGGTGVESA